MDGSLRRIASRLLARERPNLTLDQTTALVNQAYTRLLHRQEVSWQNREIRRRIREEDAPLPSVRVRSASHAESALELGEDVALKYRSRLDENAMP